MAGLVGSTYVGWLFVADLWVHAELRRRGVGRELLARAERRAVKLGFTRCGSTHSHFSRPRRGRFWPGTAAMLFFNW